MTLLGSTREAMERSKREDRNTLYEEERMDQIKKLEQTGMYDTSPLALIAQMGNIAMNISKEVPLAKTLCSFHCAK